MSDRHRITITSDQYGSTWGAFIDSESPLTEGDVWEWLQNAGMRAIGYTPENAKESEAA